MLSSLRVFRVEPRFALSILLVNGLALGGLTSIFSIIHTVLLRPAPYPRAEEVVLFEDGRRPRLSTWSAPFYREIERSSETFVAIGAFRNKSIALTMGEETNQLRSSIASSGLFRALGVSPLYGRTFVESDDGSGQSDSVIISESLWDRLFAKSIEAVGTRLILDGKPRTVVGVMPAKFAFPDSGVEVWLPLGELGGALEFPHSRMLHPVARLKPGTHRDAAREEVASIIRQLNLRHIERAAHKTDFVLRSLQRQLYAETIGGVGFRPQTMRNVASSLYLLSIAALLTLAGAGLYVTSLGLIRSEQRILARLIPELSWKA